MAYGFSHDADTPEDAVKRLCILHANCQGDPLAFLLAASPEFSARYAVRRFVNYRRDPIPGDLLARCALFLFQPLGDAWDELASSRLAERLPQDARCLQIPNMFFKGYWPFWTNAGPLDFGDSFLDRLAEQGLSQAEAMHVYLHGKLETKFDLDAIADETLARERDKERLAEVRSADFVAMHWRNRQLFTSVNHPAPELMIRAADGILAALDLPPAPEAAKRACPPCDADFDLPIHPAVGRHFGLPFVSEARRYNIFGHPMSFAEYAACYMDCRLRGLDNFIAYLHLVKK
ncbi:MAG: hypothetical protein LBC10_04965 [Deltaproteobacteria bacterium]|jgi:hypothetical protein|nr:hypothetical protein [Deltaproteobacteria bacterium]